MRISVDIECPVYNAKTKEEQDELVGQFVINTDLYPDEIFSSHWNTIFELFRQRMHEEYIKHLQKKFTEEEDDT